MGKTINQFQNAKINRERISMCTAYDYTTARIAEEAGIDAILVGDSLGMTMLGYDTTLQVTMEDMIHHSKAVKRGAKNTFVICDMPFMSYQTNVYDAVKNAGRLMQEGMADAVKLEGGMNVKEQIRAIVNASIPVMAHIGMTPQSVNQFGGFKVQGKNYDSARQIIEDAKAVEEAGAFAVTLECVPNDLASLITKVLDIPTIGIGAGAKCNGQVLVYQDMLGMTSDIHPKFVKQFAKVGDAMKEGFSRYIKEVKSGSFPSKENTYSIEEEVMEKLTDIKKEAEKKAMKRHIQKTNKDKQDNTQGQGDKE